jgi:hypothetical protein
LREDFHLVVVVEISNVEVRALGCRSELGGESGYQKVPGGFMEVLTLYPVTTKNTYVAISRNSSSSQAYWNGTVILSKNLRNKSRESNRDKLGNARATYTMIRVK